MPTGKKWGKLKMSEENKNTQSQEADVEETKDTQGQEGQGQEGQEGQQQEEKTFTQSEIDKLIAERLKRERAKQPKKEELDAFNSWKKSQQTEQERLEAERKEFESTKQELTKLRNEKEVLKSGVDNKFSDYVTFEVSKMEGDFADNLSDFLKNNPQFSQKSDNFQGETTPKATGQKFKNEGAGVDLSQLSDEEYFKQKGFKKK